MEPKSAPLCDECVAAQLGVTLLGAGVAEAAQRAAVKASQKRQLRLIYDCAVRLIDFVSSMMEFSALRQRAKKAEGDAGEGPTMNKDPVAIVSSNPPQSRFKKLLDC